MTEPERSRGPTTTHLRPRVRYAVGTAGALILAAACATAFSVFLLNLPAARSSVGPGLPIDGDYSASIEAFAAKRAPRTPKGPRLTALDDPDSLSADRARARGLALLPPDRGPDPQRPDARIEAAHGVFAPADATDGGPDFDREEIVVLLPRAYASLTAGGFAPPFVASIPAVRPSLDGVGSLPDNAGLVPGEDAGPPTAVPRPRPSGGESGAAGRRPAAGAAKPAMVASAAAGTESGSPAVPSRRRAVEPGAADDEARIAWPGNRSRVAIYDVSGATVYLPNGERLEAHSGMGALRDNPKHAHVKMRGPTPPATYALRMREQRFHGVEAIRLLPVDGVQPLGRDGLLAHSYMLRIPGDSNGCVVFADYRRFLAAFKAGKITHMVVVPTLPKGQAQLARLFPPTRVSEDRTRLPFAGRGS